MCACVCVCVYCAELLSAGVENVVQEFERLDQANGGPVQRALQAGTAALGPGGAAARRTVALLDGRQVVVDGSNHVRVLDTPDEGKAISSIQVRSVCVCVCVCVCACVVSVLPCRSHNDVCSVHRRGHLFVCVLQATEFCVSI